MPITINIFTTSCLTDKNYKFLSESLPKYDTTLTGLLFGVKIEKMLTRIFLSKKDLSPQLWQIKEMLEKYSEQWHDMMLYGSICNNML